MSYPLLSPAQFECCTAGGEVSDKLIDAAFDVLCKGLPVGRVVFQVPGNGDKLAHACDHIVKQHGRIRQAYLDRDAAWGEIEMLLDKLVFGRKC